MGEELLPGGAEYPVPGYRADQQLVQLIDQAVALALVHHESEIQIVGGLSDQVDLLLLEEFEGVPELMEDGADVAPDQAHGSAGPDELYAAQARQIADQIGQHCTIERVGRRVQR